MEYYEVAAKWWADKLRNVTFGDFYKKRTSPSGAEAFLMTTIFARDHKPGDDECYNVFEKILANIIKERVEIIEPYTFSLSVHYSPDEYLTMAATDAGIVHYIFPWNTRMLIRKDSIIVISGTDSEKSEEVIYPIP